MGMLFRLSEVPLYPICQRCAARLDAPHHLSTHTPRPLPQSFKASIRKGCGLGDAEGGRGMERKRDPEANGGFRNRGRRHGGRLLPVSSRNVQTTDQFLALQELSANSTNRSSCFTMKSQQHNAEERWRTEDGDTGVGAESPDTHCLPQQQGSRGESHKKQLPP